MKRFNTAIVLLIGIIFVDYSLSRAQQKPVKTYATNGLPSGVIVRNFSFAIYDIERQEGSARIRFVCRKTGFSGEKFPVTTIKVFDDHENVYETGYIGPSLNDFYDLIAASPIGFTWVFDVSVDIPLAAPIVKIELRKDVWTLLNTISLSRNSLKKLDLKREVIDFPLSNVHNISIDEWIKQDKFLEWTVKKIRLFNTRHQIGPYNVERMWLLPIVVHNLDYNPKDFLLSFFFQLDDGRVVPYKVSSDIFSNEKDIDGYFCEGDNCQDLPGQVDIKDIPAQSTKPLNYFYFPVLLDGTPRIPTKIFILNIKQKLDYRVQRELVVLNIKLSIFDRSNVTTEIKNSMESWKKVFQNDMANAIAFTFGENLEKFTPELEKNYVNYNNDGSFTMKWGLIFSNWEVAGSPNVLKLLTRQETLEKFLYNSLERFEKLKDDPDPKNREFALKRLRIARTIERYLRENTSEDSLKRIVNDGPVINMVEIEKIMHEYGFDQKSVEELLIINSVER